MCIYKIKHPYALLHGSEHPVVIYMNCQQHRCRQNRQVQVTQLSSPITEVQALRWCRMCSTFLKFFYFAHHLMVIVYNFPFDMHILCNHIALYWPTLQFYQCVYVSFGCMWRPLVSAITTPSYAMLHMCMLFHSIVQRIFNKIKVRPSSSYPKLPLCQSSSFVQTPLLS